jgi:CRP/FNR family transcriptional regulator, cyclic AMP receptor protein
MNADRLQSLDYFRGMTAAEVEVVAGAMNEDAWWDGSMVVQQGDQKGSVYFVLEGSIRIERRLENGEIITVGHLGPGAVFGILGVLDGVPRAANCVSEGTTRCAVMNRTDFLDLMSGTTPLALRFQLAVLRCLARDIRSTNSRLAELAAVPACRVSLNDLDEVF